MAEKAQHPILITFLIFVVLILAFAIIFGTIKLTGKTVYLPNQDNNELNYNPPIQPPKENNQQDWGGIVYELENQIKVVALELNIPISEINVFTESSGKPFQIGVQLKKGWKHDADYMDIFLTKSSQIIKNLGLEVTSVRTDFETEMIYFYIE